MKKYSLLWKAGCAIAIGVICLIAPPRQRINAQSQYGDSYSGPCDRLIGTMCNKVYQNNQTITTIDQTQTEEVCGYTKTCTPTPPVTLAFVQDLLQRSEKATESATALVYPNIFPDRLEILVIPSSGQEIRKVVTTIGKDKADQTVKEKIDETVLDLLNAIRDPSSEDYLPAAEKLYDWLIRPIESDLESAEIKTLVFVMSGSLRSVPISVLHDGKKFLVQKYALATVPSMGYQQLI